MRLFNTAILSQGKIEESILVPSFQVYKSLGGKYDMLDIYSRIKERAKEYESRFISCMDMKISGISVEDREIVMNRLIAQVYWTILSKWFDKPLRKVSFVNFDLDEFNRL